MRRLAYIAIGAALLAAAAFAAIALLDSPSAAQAGDGTAVVSVNTNDGKTVFKVKLTIVRENGDVVDASNVAVAYASCTDCMTATVSFQAVLVTGDPSVVDPSNMAIAVNDGCSGCRTLADAVQYVMSTGGQVRFTQAARQELNDIRKSLHDLRKSDLSLDELKSQLDELSARFATVLASGLVIVGTDQSG